MPKTSEVKCHGETVVRSLRDLSAAERREVHLDLAMINRDYPGATSRKTITTLRERF